MKVTKCDKCGKTFSLLDEAKYYSPSDEYWRLDIYYDHHPYPATKLDLCNNCKKSLYSWLKGSVYYEKK